MRQNSNLMNLYNTILSLNREHVKVSFPAEIGKGLVLQWRIKQGITITDWKMNYNRETLVRENSSLYFVNLYFCVKGEMCWEREKDRNEIEEGDMYLYRSKGELEVGYYEKEKNYEFISIKMPESIFMEIIMQYLDKREFKNVIYHINKGLKFSANHHINRILYSLREIPKNKGLASMYLEGKLYELIAVYLSNIIEKDRECYYSIKLISEDVDAINKAKNIIDNNLTNLPTVNELAKLVNINTSKLSQGFRMIFGVPVYTYGIKQRLEYAAYLLDTTNKNIGEIATLLGYTSMSHFSYAFKKQFGLLPKEYRKK
ncbi:helix-turn-helix domain-containing protein [Clostridium kluyveri]|uniref:HTH araC/xylS-type domain-containing protein n=1 Tax=Clostridium kluyveri TaxID=1534 RepID=A0A1L5F6J4_CLOKL|nr:helix-turn-helix domain-containing protein [Clostridium kluyveri]APM38460.1 hypothetical protein BS101_06765 [Clostridium kluyveri]